MHVQGREYGFGFVAQEPWIQHATMRDNILFGKDFDSGFYQDVLEACALIADLNVSSFLYFTILKSTHSPFNWENSSPMKMKLLKPSQMIKRSGKMYQDWMFVVFCWLFCAK